MRKVQRVSTLVCLNSREGIEQGRARGRDCLIAYEGSAIFKCGMRFDEKKWRTKENRVFESQEDES